VIPHFPVYLFDIDGTLLDSAADICGAVQYVLSSTPTPQVRPFEYLKSFIGLHLIDLFTDVYPDYSAQQIDGLILQYRTNYLSRGHTQTSVYPGVVEGLAALGGRKSTATTKGSPTTRAVLEQFGLIQYFDHVQGTDGFPCKPAPDVVLTALAALGARPEDCLFVGDSPADMEAGRRAGVRTCAVRYGYGKTEELARWSPDYWVGDLRELGAG
jgi:HAD superfamily hydrolase (TIGR01509 family)